MFTGIIEELAEVVSVTQKGGNVDLKVKSNLTKELKIDQSVAHNGCCLTVVEIENDTYTVTAIEETLNRTTIGLL
ncbi:riboflavin synthase, partial [Flavobacteriales bacterium]|nr:riboflavin synthase [Flavobacteriales bacterium]